MLFSAGMKLPVLLAAALASCTPLPDDPATQPDGGGVGGGGGGKADGTGMAMRLLQANVGNVAVTCTTYKYKLCYAATEERLAAAIANLDPDVISLQETVSAAQCAAMTESDAAKVCFATHTAAIEVQARRLVGAAYTVACDTRAHYECVAIKRTWGAIRGCADGELCIASAVAQTADAGAGCDPGFSVSAVTVEPRRGAAFRLVDLHPPSGKAVACRRAALVDVFEGPAALARGNRSLLSGDFNLDPFAGTDASEDYLRSRVGPGTAFHFHSGTAEHQPPFLTAVYDWPLGSFTYDHVISNFAAGTCRTLGAAPGTVRLDGGTGTDHRALVCDLDIE